MFLMNNIFVVDKYLQGTLEIRFQVLTNGEIQIEPKYAKKYMELKGINDYNY